MKPLTVSELHSMLSEIVANGGGNKTLYVSTDEEGNDYHPMWFAPMTNPKDIREFMQYTCSGLSPDVDVENAVLLG